MREELKATSTAADFAALRQLFGPPPLLSSENAQAYDETMARLVECFAPLDFIEQMLIKEWADCSWEMARYARHKALATERRFRQRLEFQAQRHKAATQNKDAPAKNPAEQNRQPATEPADVLDGLVEEIDEILLKPATELAHARALEVAITYIERLDKLHITATARRNNVLDQIERYRAGLGLRLRQVSDKIIEHEPNAVEAQPNQVAAPLAPSDEQQQ
jgi:hypothetical protein